MSEELLVADTIVHHAAEIRRLRAEVEELIKTLQQPDQVGYWQRRAELAEEKLVKLRTALEEIANDLDTPSDIVVYAKNALAEREGK
jgi:hypothetical protein